MTMIEQIHRGRRHSPPRLLIYGTEGIGKSTTAAQAPNPIFIPTEDGLDQIDCCSFPLAKSLTDVEGRCALIASSTTSRRSSSTRPTGCLVWMLVSSMAAASRRSMAAMPAATSTP